MNTDRQWEMFKAPQPDSIVMENGRVKVRYRNSTNNVAPPSASPRRHRLTRDSLDDYDTLLMRLPSSTSTKKKKKKRIQTPAALMKKPPPLAPKPPPLLQQHSDNNHNEATTTATQTSGTTRTSTTTTRCCHEIEIAPGVWARLRGAAETQACMQRGDYAPTTCVACRMALYCIDSAHYVICPACRVVSPIMGLHRPARRPAGVGGGSSVGLGFTTADLISCQAQQQHE